MELHSWRYQFLEHICQEYMTRPQYMLCITFSSGSFWKQYLLNIENLSSIIGLSLATATFAFGLIADVTNSSRLFAWKNLFSVARYSTIKCYIRKYPYDTNGTHMLISSLCHSAPMEILISILYWGISAVSLRLIFLSGPSDWPMRQVLPVFWCVYRLYLPNLFSWEFHQMVYMLRHDRMYTQQLPSKIMAFSMVKIWNDDIRYRVICWFCWLFHTIQQGCFLLVYGLTMMFSYQKFRSTGASWCPQKLICQ